MSLPKGSDVLLQPAPCPIPATRGRPRLQEKPPQSRPLSEARGDTPGQHMAPSGDPPHSLLQLQRRAREKRRGQDGRWMNQTMHFCASIRGGGDESWAGSASPTGKQHGRGLHPRSSEGKPGSAQTSHPRWPLWLPWARRTYFPEQRVCRNSESLVNCPALLLRRETAHALSTVASPAFSVGDTCRERGASSRKCPERGSEAGASGRGPESLAGTRPGLEARGQTGPLGPGGFSVLTYQLLK